MKILLIIWPLCFGLWSDTSLAAPECEATLERHALRIGAKAGPETPQDWLTRLLANGDVLGFEPGEIYGERSFTQVLSSGWVFTLLRQEYGWSLRIYDKDQAEGGVDMTSITPPFSASLPNTRDLFGWHFRNQKNTGPNLGDVNAPQHLRPFSFSRSLAGTGGFKPSSRGSELRFTPVHPDGRGWLLIHEMGLTSQEEGEPANMNYLKFEACLTWPKSEEEKIDERGQASFDYIDEEIEVFGSCGLDLLSYQLDARVLPRSLSGDLDGDDSIDDLAQIVGLTDGQRDLVLCRAGSWHHLLDQSERSTDFLLTVQALEKWQIVPNNFAEVGSSGGETQWPQADGDILILERIEKSMYLVYWSDKRLQVRKVYRFVEP